MNEGKENTLLVKDFYQKVKTRIELRPVLGRVGFTRRIDSSTSKGHLLPIQILGKNEIDHMNRLSAGEMDNYIKKKLQRVSCVILSEGFIFPQAVERHAREKKIALFVTSLSEKVCRERLRSLLPILKSAQIILSGGLVRIFGIGLLIIGDSGVGKSESMLELISRGHRFVCDDVVQVQKNEEGKIEGSAAPLSRNFMEIRGLGIINIKKIYGPGSISPKAKIDLVIELKKWKEGKEYDRLGLEFPESHNILETTIPKISIPVAPGRNIATIIEVACKVFLLKKKGYLAAEEISKKLEQELSLG